MLVRVQVPSRVQKAETKVSAFLFYMVFYNDWKNRYIYQNINLTNYEKYSFDSN